MSDIPDEINALPQRQRDYIHHLETDADPSGTLRENFRLREENAALRTECEKLIRWARYIAIIRIVGALLVGWGVGHWLGRIGF